LKLSLEAVVFRHLEDDGSPALKQTARLLAGELAEITTSRFLVGLVGGVLLPLTFIVQRPAAGFSTLGVTLWIFVFAVGGELLERFLFFTASVPMRMPGGIEA
jgi:formate dehydrogenase iron-sulfur subunit